MTTCIWKHYLKYSSNNCTLKQLIQEMTILIYVLFKALNVFQNTHSRKRRLIFEEHHSFSKY